METPQNPLPGASLDVTDENGAKHTLTVQALRVGRYNAAANALDADDEPAWCDVVIGKPRGFSATLTPESYEVLQNAARAVNQRFFGFFARRVALRALRSPDVLMAAADSQQPGESHSHRMSHGSPPAPV